MPRTISREAALERIGNERGVSGCLLCALRDGSLGAPLVVAEGEHCLALLPRYATRWGHIMVLLREHVTRFADVDRRAWQQASDLALEAARTLEATLTPRRCYVASLGSARDDLPMTSPHLHLHAIPVYEDDDKPATVLTWSAGVVVAEEQEWEELRGRLRGAWPVQQRGKR